MMATGIFLGAIAAFALIVIFTKSPMWFKRWSLKHPLISELVSFAFLFISISSITASIEGVIGAFTAGAIWTIFYFVYRYNNKEENNGYTENSNASDKFRRQEAT